MRVSYSTLPSQSQETVNGLAQGYELDCRNGVTMLEQAERLLRWRSDGWSEQWYGYHVISMLMGYSNARTKHETAQLPGFAAY